MDPDQSSFDWSFWFQWMMATSLGWVIGRLLVPSLATITIGLAIGVMQWFLLYRRIEDSWWWIVATAFGSALGSFLILLILPEELDAFAGLIFGLAIGFAQWVVLSRFIQHSGWWIAINVIAWITGMGLLPGLLLTGVIAGLITATGMTWLMNFPRRGEALEGSQSQ